MKIVSVTPYLVKEWRTMLFVKVETDEGIVGIGEGGLTSREQGVAGIVEALAPLLVGADPMRTEHLWQLMWRSGFHPSNQVLTAAIAAIVIALGAMMGKALGVQVYQLLGGKGRDKDDSHCHRADASPEERLGIARQRVAEGWNCLRWDSGPF